MSNHTPPNMFTFSTAGRIIFGSGCIEQLPQTVGLLGSTALVVCGHNQSRVQPILDAVGNAGISVSVVNIEGEPNIEMVSDGAKLAQSKGADCIVAIGGGSVIDAGKAIAALSTNPGPALDYLEVVGKGKPLASTPLPIIAVPTTSGTGAEVTANAVLESTEHRVKVSLRHPSMLPHTALVDPELTLSVPPEITAATGLDALTQVLEPYVSTMANPLTDLFCRQGIKLAAQGLPKAVADGRDLNAREAMAQVSLFGGLALANAKLGAVHGIAGPFGGMYKAPHGAVCGILLPHVMQANIQALKKRQPDHFSLTRYEEIACMLTGSDEADIFDGPAAVQKMVETFNLPGLSAYGFHLGELELLMTKAQQASSMKGNPISLTSDELKHILRAAM